MKGQRAGWSRRDVLAAGLGCAVAVAAGCSADSGSGRAVGVDSEAVRVAEARRRAGSAPVRRFALRAESSVVDLGGVLVSTWTYGGRLPGAEIRLGRGEVAAVRVDNALPQASTVHWHGLALRADMDGVPGLTQAPIAAGTGSDYEFTVPDAGTYWLHPHTGVQLDRGLYAPLIVEDPADGADYDLEAVVVLDDWLDGIEGRDPDTELARLRAAGMHDMSAHPAQAGGHAGHGGHQTAQSAPLGDHGGDVSYPLFLINGRAPTDPVTFDARPGQRMRLRIINAAADTAFRVALGRHRLRVTHSDGFPVFATTTDSLLIGMGERYDAVVELAEGVFPLLAAAEGKTGQAMALIRTGPGQAPDPRVRVRELATAPLTVDRLRADPAVRLPARAPDKVLDVRLGADAARYVWTINDHAPLDGSVHEGGHTVFEVSQGQRVRLRLVNATTMFHPMHLHGHTFAMVDGSGGGPRKDTVIVAAGDTVEVDFDANNPGQWMLHCHNAYHGEAGMMSVLSYRH
ncbi:multicopper oxidase family protein [Nocardia noduli]|uniref:multicopper oxidase family protein n=1 Tax=Nocardia noduli TaxID=2815722 RepID=UPI0027DFE946|nr:multicopper oxidase family protein [Nocardia noduli]